MLKLNVTVLFIHIWKISLSEVIVETNSGPIRSTASLLDDVDAFLGVPYAEPPVGDLRFAKPVEKQHWKEIYNASSFAPACVQPHWNLSYYYLPDLSRMSEDCLYLNIWVPKAKPEEDLRPVIVYFHSGSFSSGTSTEKVSDGSHLASEGNAVVVTFDYRLGSFGFFLAYIEEADGNMGIYDQLMAIKWVKDNAEHFGGDPENIALMGHSAGAWSVGIHMVSPLSQHLFRRAIFQSGAIINALLTEGNNRLIKSSSLFASAVGCTNENVSLSNDPRSVVECLKGKSSEFLIETELSLVSTNLVLFFPRIGDQILPDEGPSMFREGKFRRDIDVMIGVTKNEGGVLLVGALYDEIGLDGSIPIEMPKSRVTLMARLLAINGGMPNPEEFVNYYLSKIEYPTAEGYMNALSYAVGDFAVSCGAVFLADFVSLKGNRVYFYEFGYRSSSTPMAEWVEVTHLDDIQYAFGNPYHEDFTPEEEELSRRFIARISSFAKSGNPNVPGQIPWLRYSYHNPLYLNIGQEEESIRLKPSERCKFWRKEFQSEIGPDLIRFLRNSGMNLTNEWEALTPNLYHFNW